MSLPKQIESPVAERKVPAWIGLVRWRHFPLLCLTVWCLIGVAMRSGPAATVLTSADSRTDFMVPISGAWALASGLHIHKDFSTPLGLAYYLPYYWVLKMVGSTDAVVRHVASVIFVGISVLSFLLLKPPRYSWKITALGVGFISLLAASPGILGRPPTVIYEGLGYNYLGIAFGYLCLLTALFPPRGTLTEIKGREIRDGLLLAAALVWIAFVKINYLAQNAVFLVAALAVYRITQGKRSVWFPAALAGGFLLFALAFVLVFRIDVGAMLRDIQMATNARSRWSMEVIKSTDGNGGWYNGVTGTLLRAEGTLIAHQVELGILACVVLGGMAALAILGRAPLSRVAVYGVLMLVVVAFDTFQCLFNTYGNTLPMIPFLWMFILCVLERGEWVKEELPTAEMARRTRSWISGLATLAVAYYIAPLVVGHAAAFAGNSGMAKSDSYLPEEHLQAKGWENLRFTEGLTPEPTTNLTFVASINRGLDLLRKNGLDQKRIFVFDQINPFPFLLRAPYPAGQPAWMHPQATFDQDSYLPAETIFAGADIVMLPVDPFNPACPGVLNMLYGAYLQGRYTVAAQNDQWVALQKK